MMKQPLNFSITGEYIYNMGRDFMIEGRWTKAIELFHKGLIGIDLDLVTHLCKGNLQLTGKDEVEILYEPDKELQDKLERYPGSHFMEVICNRSKTCKYQRICGGARPHSENHCEKCPYDKTAKCIPVEESKEMTDAQGNN